MSQRNANYDTKRMNNVLTNCGKRFNKDYYVGACVPNQYNIKVLFCFLILILNINV